MQIKVCGNLLNFTEVSELRPDYLGIIFYPASPRFALGTLKREDLSPRRNAKLIGVFVNAPISEICKRVEEYQLDGIQLHGDETPSTLSTLKSSLAGKLIIKAFRVNSSFSKDIVSPFEQVSDIFLFDRDSEKFGGAGEQFNWDILTNEICTKPFLLSGGIASDSVPQILRLKARLPNLIGVDLNSRFETQPGLKDIRRIRSFIKELESETYT